MDNEETMLDDELDTELEEDTADVEDDATDDGDEDDEFEYDEDGNIIIPDVVDDDEEDDDTVDKEGEPDDSDESEDSDEPEDVAEPDNAQDAKDARIAQLEAELRKIRSQGKETLSKLGVKSDDVMEGLVSLAAEADGITPQEYLQKKSAEEMDAQGRALLQQQAFEKIAAADLAELHAAYPETKQYTHIRNLPDDIKMKFGRFRDAGLSAKEAYAAANPDGIRTQVATAVKKQSLHDSKSHLRTTVPKGSKDTSIVMPKSELARWRDYFPDKSDKDIIALYKSTAT
jgi:hypothetical protein